MIDFSPFEINEQELLSQSSERAILTLINRASAMRASDLFLLSGHEKLTVSVRQWGIVRKVLEVDAQTGLERATASSRCDHDRRGP